MQVYGSSAAPKKMLWMLDELKGDRGSTDEDYSIADSAPVYGTTPQGLPRLFSCPF
jgi:hypothetical protein